MTVDIEQELRASLRREVDRVEVPPAPDLEPAPAPARWWRRARGTRVAAIAVAGVAVVAVAVTAFAVPALLRGNETPLPPAQSYDSALSPEHWPVRGPLAHDKELLSRARSWFAANVSNTVKQKPSDFHIVYAGDVEKYRIVVATFERTYDGPKRPRYREFVMLHTAPGSTDLDTAQEFGELQLAQSTDPQSSRSMAVVELGYPSRTVLVIAPPGANRVDYSPTAQLRADGTITRSWSTPNPISESDGISYITAPEDDVRPRIRSVADGRVVADSRLQASVAVDDEEATRLRGLIQAGSDGQAVGRLASELYQFEYAIGRVIERVDVLRTFGPDDDYWVMAVVRTTGGGAVEVFFSDDPKKSDRPDGTYGLGGSPSPLVGRLVPAARAGEEPAVWLAEDQCRVLGWDPTGRTASLEFIVNGKAQPRVQTASEPIDARVCDVQREPDDTAEYTVRLYDQSGEQIWSGEPAFNRNRGSINEHTNLDTPSTIGARVG